jgi:hypothetical protein
MSAIRSSMVDTSTFTPAGLPVAGAIAAAADCAV